MVVIRKERGWERAVPTSLESDGVFNGCLPG